MREATQRDYIRFVQSFAAFLKRPPDTATAEDNRLVHATITISAPAATNSRSPSPSPLRFNGRIRLSRKHVRAVNSVAVKARTREDQP
jgi:integrase/recombinase XerD